jgi:hypothetical protein
MQAPGGGPIDEEPPVLVQVLPEPGPGQPGLAVVRLEWSERLDPASAAVFLYPPIEHRLNISGDAMTVELADPLGEGIVVIHVPPEISDARGNDSGIPHDLVYGGGELLPACEIGITLDRQAGGSLSDRTLAELYMGDDVDGTGLVRRTSADSLGSVTMKWLTPGTYRLLCYEDMDRSFQWSSDVEAGMDTIIVLESPADTLDLAMTLTVVDTLGPILVEAGAPDRFHVSITMNEEVSLESFSEGEFTLLHDSSGTSVPVNGMWLQGGAADATLTLETYDLGTGELTLYLEGVRDLLGNPSSRDSMVIAVSDSLPTDSLRIRSHYPAPGGEGIDPAGPYSISFSYFVDLDSLDARFSLTRLADSTEVDGRLIRIDGRAFDFIPNHQLVGEQQHLFMLLPGLHTAWGDSLLEPFSWAFEPAWGDEPGSISGSVSGTSAPLVVLQVSRTGGEGDGSMRFAVIAPGSFLLEDVTAGRYTVSAFIDTDGGMDWDPMEPYGTHPGVVMVQPGLVSEGVDIDILP